MISKKEFSETFLIAVIYAAIFFAFQFFCHRAGYFPTAPEGDKLKIFDAGWYHSIVEKGYENGKGGSNTAFFILLPLIWKLTHLTSMGMSLLNVFFFSLGFAVFSQVIRSSVTDKIIWLATPALMFMFIPYTEALFFLLVSLVFFGITYEKKWLIALCLFVISFLRPTVIFMVPAALAMELMTNNRINYMRVLRDYMVVYLLPTLIGMGIFNWYQFHETGVWFSYFYQQSENWGHKFSMPAFPFNTLDGNRTIWINALAVFIAVLSLVHILILAFRWMVRKELTENKLLVLSLCYMVITLVYGIFCNPKWGPNLTLISGFHRYTMATPFFFVVVHYFGQKKYKARDFVVLILLANALWMLFGAYQHIQQVMFYNFNTILIVLYLLYAQKRLSWPAMALFALSFFVQATMFQQAISGLFPD